MDLRSPDVLPTAPSTIQVVLIDDDRDVQLLVELAFSRADGLELVGQAHGAAVGIATVLEAQPDVVLLDLHLGTDWGGDLVGPLLRGCPRAMVSVFSSMPAAEHEEALRHLGAFAYYPKDRLQLLPELIRRDYELFCRALDGSSVVAPGTDTAQPTTLTEGPHRPGHR